MGSTSLTTGKTSKGVVTLEGVWSEKQLDNFDAMSIEEQHEFFKHYNERLNRHKRGESKRGGGKADCTKQSEHDNTPCETEAYCAGASTMRACWLQDQAGCASMGAKCEWNPDQTGTQCG